MDLGYCMWLASYISQYTYTKKCHETPNRLLPKIWSYSVDIIDQLRDYERPDNHGKSYLKSFISRSMSLTAGLFLVVMGQAWGSAQARHLEGLLEVVFCRLDPSIGWVKPQVSGSGSARARNLEARPITNSWVVCQSVLGKNEQ